MAINSEKEVYKYSNVHINQLKKPNKKKCNMYFSKLLFRFYCILYVYLYNMSKRYIIINEKIK